MLYSKKLLIAVDPMLGYVASAPGRKGGGGSLWLSEFSFFLPFSSLHLSPQDNPFSDLFPNLIREVSFVKPRARLWSFLKWTLNFI